MESNGHASPARTSMFFGGEAAILRERPTYLIPSMCASPYEGGKLRNSVTSCLK